MFGKLTRLFNGRSEPTPARSAEVPEGYWEGLSVRQKRAVTGMYLDTVFGPAKHPEPRHVSELFAPPAALTGMLIEELREAHTKDDKDAVQLLREGLLALAWFSDVPLESLQSLRNAQARLPELRAAVEKGGGAPDVSAAMDLVAEEALGCMRRIREQMRLLIKAETPEQRFRHPWPSRYAPYLDKGVGADPSYDCARGASKAADSSLGLMWLLVAGEFGHVDAQASLGACYWRDRDEDPDNLGKAVNWYERAASGGHTAVQALLGNLYLAGMGVPQDSDKALHWLLQAAQSGDARAQLQAGAMLHDAGQSHEALEWYTKAALQGLPDAQVSLAQMYFKGDATPRDLAKAVHWSEQAAAQGDVPAMIWLAHRYAESGEVHDAARSMYWNERGALSGDVGCVLRLALSFGDDESPSFDPLSAYRWSYTGTRIAAEAKQIEMFETLCTSYGEGLSERDRHVVIRLSEDWLASRSAQPAPAAAE
jgi:tetratricopeptide (TPR) repeat protein